MPSFASVLVTLLAAGHLAAAHMELSYPAPFRSKFNPNAGSNIDYSMTAPLSGDGSNYPCKGYHKDVGTAAGAPTASFAPGSTYNMTITGGAAHGGGSCQAALSYDGGATFTVIESIIGGCPLSSNYDFTVPADAPTGTAIFSWTWQNAIGNRELYQNCAAVTIGGGGAKRRDTIVKPRASFSSRPGIFLANIGNGCTTVEMSSVKYPDPGPDVKDNGGAQAPPSGSCGASAPAAPAPGGGSGAAPGGGSGAAPGGGSGAAPSSPATPPTGSKPPTAPSTAPKPTVIPAPGGGGSGAKPSGPPGGVFITMPVPEPAAPTGTAPAPTTMMTATRPAASPVAPGPTAPAAAPAPAPATPAAGAQSGACTNEGAWNCVDGKSFQRCASGRWSAVIQMATGTSCTVGVSEVLGMAGRRVRRS